MKIIKRKAIWAAICPPIFGTEIITTIVCDDGSVWQYLNKKWQKMPELPDTD